jgi:hypothetical protein
MGITTNVGSPGAVSSASGGKVYAYNAISTAPAVVAPANTSRQTIVFHNPGTGNLYVGPSQVLNAAGSGVPLTPTTAAVGGCFILFPGATLTVTGECQGSWQAFAAANANNPLTVMDSNL